MDGYYDWVKEHIEEVSSVSEELSCLSMNRLDAASPFAESPAYTGCSAE